MAAILRKAQYSQRFVASLLAPHPHASPLPGAVALVGHPEARADVLALDLVAHGADVLCGVRKPLRPDDALEDAVGLAVSDAKTSEVCVFL